MILGIIFTRSGPAVSTAAAVAVAVAKVSPLAAADRIIMLHWRLVEVEVECSPDISGVISVPQPDTPEISGGTPMAGTENTILSVPLFL